MACLLKTVLAVLAVLIAAPSVQAQSPGGAAQQQMSQDDLISIVQTLEGQRNQAQTSHALAEAKAAALAKENAKLKAELEQLKKPPEGSK